MPLCRAPAVSRHHAPGAVLGGKVELAAAAGQRDEQRGAGGQPLVVAGVQNRTPSEKRWIPPSAAPLVNA